MGRYFWIIFVLLGLWHLIGSLAERATKKQQDRRVSDLAGQQRQQQMAAHRTVAGGAAQRATGPVVADRAGELAARRKAQLDELRRRRGAATAQATGQPPGRTRPMSATLRPAQSPPRQAPPLPVAATPPVAVPQRPPVAVPQRRPAPVRRQPAARPQARRAPPPQKRTIPPIERSPKSGRSLVSTARTVEARGLRTLTLPSLGDVPMDRTLLRRMMLYREILEPPIALREVQSWER